MCLYVIYKPCAKPSREKIVNIIMFAQFEEEDLLSEIRNDVKLVTNPMTIQLCHHYLAKKKWMRSFLMMSKMKNLCLRIC